MGIIFIMVRPMKLTQHTQSVWKENILLKRNPDSVLSVSATTRLPRPGETDGKEYFFVSREKFEETIKKDGFLEYACFCDNYYGTPKKAVDEKLENGFNVILEIEVQGAMQIKEKVPEAVFVFISPPSKKVLRERIEGRGTETPEVINKRMTLAENELKQIVNYDYLIVNDEVEKAVKSFEDIVNAERLKTSRNLNFIQEVCK